MQRPSNELHTLLENASMSGSITSPGYYVGDASSVCLQGKIVTSNAVGTVSIEGSLDGDTWTNIPLSPTPAAASADDTFLIEFPECCFYALRLKYTCTSGEGLLTVKVGAKAN
jgi:hypothetical protein